jgi:hypothetical protein
MVGGLVVLVNSVTITAVVAPPRMDPGEARR